MSFGDHVHIAKVIRGRGPRTKRARARAAERRAAEDRVQQHNAAVRRASRPLPPAA